MHKSTSSKEAFVLTTRYERALKKFVQGFWKPGQTIVLDSKYEASPSDGVKCEACGWPYSPHALGLRDVHVLRNLQTGETRAVGSNCVENYQSFMRTIEPTFELRVRARAEKPFVTHQSTDVSPYYLDHWGVDELWEYDEARSQLLEELASEETYNYYFGDDDFVDVEDHQLGIRPCYHDDPVFEELFG